MHFIKIVYMTLVKDIESGFTTRGLLQWDFVIEERDQAQLPIWQGKVRIYSQGGGWCSVDRKLLRGSIRVRRGFMMKTGQGDQTSPGDDGEWGTQSESQGGYSGYRHWARFLQKLDPAEDNMDAQKSSLVEQLFIGCSCRMISQSCMLDTMTKWISSS